MLITSRAAASFITTTLVILLANIAVSSGQTCLGGDETVHGNITAAQGVPTHVLTGDLQLLVPAWTLNMGYVNVWKAVVQGIANDSSIDFQIFEPHPQNNGVFNLLYGNIFKDDVGHNQTGENISIIVDTNINPPVIPARPGYIIGIRLRNTTDPNFGLQYVSAGLGEGVDVYYWNMGGNGGQDCSLSTCNTNATVLRGVIPLVSWQFCHRAQLSAETIVFDLFKSSRPLVCSGVALPACPQVTVTPVPSSSTSPSPSLLQSSATIPVSTPQGIPLASITLEASTTSSSVILVTSSSTTPLNSKQTPITDKPQSVTTHSQTSAIFPSSSPTSTVSPTTPTSFLDSLTNIVALSVAVFLLLLVIILITIIIIICIKMKRRKQSVKSLPGIDNPDYHVSSRENTIKEKPVLLTSKSPIPNEAAFPVNSTEETRLMSASPAPTPQFDEIHYSNCNPVKTPKNNQVPVTKLDTQFNHTPSSSVHVYSSLQQDNKKSPSPHPVVYSTPDDAHDYDIPGSPPSIGELANSGISNTEYFSSQDKVHYYSSPPLEAPEEHDYDETADSLSHSNVPPTHKYDEIRVLSPTGIKSPCGQVSPLPPTSPSKGYAATYVPTSSERGSLVNCRYEMSDMEGYDKLRFFEQSKTFWAPANTTSGLYEQLAAKKYREIPRDELHIKAAIGEGNFGSVSRGVWLPPDGRHEVAVKMLKPGAGEEDRVKLLQEAAIMGQFVHKNVVSLHGVVTLGEPVMMVLELMARGDLRTYLRSIRQNHIHWKNPSSNALPKLLLKFCRDISCGMAYLNKKSFVHRDLAARNILLSSTLTCKIGDFGMARDLMANDSNYYTSSGGIIPLKWTAPEALNFKKYTSASDVWSYGMVLFEIWSLGHKPFNDLSNPIVIALVNSRHCQAPPPGCSKPMYQLMVECWNPEYERRPTFDSVCTYLDSTDEVLLHWSPEDYIKGKHAHMLGAMLEDSADLYSELQRIYQKQLLEQSRRN